MILPSNAISIIEIEHGGTGNADGYIRTGIKANTTAGIQSTIEGKDNEGSGGYAHAEGRNTKASGNYAHSEGYGTISSGGMTHAEGRETTASGTQAHAEGSYTIAGYSNQHVQGTYNNNKSTTLFEIGNGTSNNRKNVFEVYNDGYLSFDNGVNKIKFGVDGNGNYGYIKAGADTVYPFNFEPTIQWSKTVTRNSASQVTFNYTKTPNYFEIYTNAATTSTTTDIICLVRGYKNSSTGNWTIAGKGVILTSVPSAKIETLSGFTLTDSGSSLTITYTGSTSAEFSNSSTVKYYVDYIY